MAEATDHRTPPAQKDRTHTARRHTTQMAGRPPHPPPTQKERQKHNEARQARPRRKADQEGEGGKDKEEGIPKGQERVAEATTHRPPPTQKDRKHLIIL